jgi:hypothetical protein
MKTKNVKVTVELTDQDIALLRKRFKRHQAASPHKLNPKLTDEWVVKMCVFESKSLETRHIIQTVIQKQIVDEYEFEERSKKSTKKFIAGCEKPGISARS